MRQFKQIPLRQEVTPFLARRSDLVCVARSRGVFLGTRGAGRSLYASLCVLVHVGIYTSNKDPISHGGGMLRAVCSTPLSSSLLGPPGTSALPRLSRSPFTSTLPSSSASISTTQVRT